MPLISMGESSHGENYRFDLADLIASRSMTIPEKAISVEMNEVTRGLANILTCGWSHVQYG